MKIGNRCSTSAVAALVAAVGFGAITTSSNAADLNTTLLNQNVAQATTEVQVAQNAAAGMRAFIRCRACHTIGEGEPNRVGPNLYGIFGRAAGTVEGYEYSPALLEAGITWDDDTLAGFLAKPKEYLVGTKMNFPGVKPTDIPNLIAYLKEAGG